MKFFVIGANKSNQITLTVNAYERAATGEYYDDNWLSCEVDICVGAFRGRYSASFLTAELIGLHQDLQQLHQTLIGSVCFEPMEGQLELKFSCDKLGQIRVDAIALDEAGIGSALHFSLSFDQTYLSHSLAGLKDVLDTFPART